MERRNFLQGIIAAAAAVASGVIPAFGGTGVQVAASTLTTGFKTEISEAVRMVYGLLRECRIEQVIRMGENTLQVTYVRDGKRRHEGPLFDWIDANGRPKSISVVTTPSDARPFDEELHFGEYVSFPITPTVEVVVDWFVADIENCPVLGYHEAAR